MTARMSRAGRSTFERDLMDRLEVEQKHSARLAKERDAALNEGRGLLAQRDTWKGIALDNEKKLADAEARAEQWKRHATDGKEELNNALQATAGHVRTLSTLVALCETRIEDSAGVTYLCAQCGPNTDAKHWPECPVGEARAVVLEHARSIPLGEALGHGRTGCMECDTPPGAGCKHSRAEWSTGRPR